MKGLSSELRSSLSGCCLFFFPLSSRSKTPPSLHVNLQSFLWLCDCWWSVLSSCTLNTGLHRWAWGSRGDAHTLRVPSFVESTHADTHTHTHTQYLCLFAHTSESKRTQRWPGSQTITLKQAHISTEHFPTRFYTLLGPLWLGVLKNNYHVLQQTS